MAHKGMSRMDVASSRCTPEHATKPRTWDVSIPPYYPWLQHIEHCHLQNSDWRREQAIMHLRWWVRNILARDTRQVDHTHSPGEAMG